MQDEISQLFHNFFKHFPNPCHTPPHSKSKFLIKFEPEGGGGGIVGLIEGIGGFGTDELGWAIAANLTSE